MGVKTRVLARQPNGAVRAARGYELTGLWLPGQGDKDALSGLALSSKVSPFTPENGSFGPALGLQGSGSAIYATALAQHKPASTASIVWVGDLSSAFSSDASLGGVTYDSANSNPYVGFALKRYISGFDYVYLTFSTGGAYYKIQTTSTYATGAVVIVGVMSNGYQRLYVKSASGIEVISGTQAITTFDYASTARVEIGDSLNARTPKAACALMGIAGAAWDDALARRILENPWRLIGNEVRPKPSLVTAGSPAVVDVPVGAITITGYAPTVTAGGTASTSVPLGTVTLTGYAPTVTTGGQVQIDVPLGTVTLTGYVPTVTTTEHAYIAVPTAAMTLSAYAPTVTAIDSFNTWNPVSVPTGTWTPSSAPGGTWTPQ